MSKPTAHAGLLRAVRERLSSLGDEELLRLWVENDRGQYSDETFEAVRSLLTERGVELPPQNDPPPMAKRLPRPERGCGTASHDATAAFWLSWLRLMLWSGVVLEGMRLVSAAVVLFEYLQVFRSSQRPSYAGAGGTLWEWLVSPGIREIATLMLIAAWFLVAAWQALQLRPRSWLVLVAYAWAAIFAAAVIAAIRISAVSLRDVSWGWYISVVADSARGAAYPFLLLVFLSRSQIKNLFDPTVGFEVARSAAQVSHGPKAE